MELCNGNNLIVKKNKHLERAKSGSVWEDEHGVNHKPK